MIFPYTAASHCITKTGFSQVQNPLGIRRKCFFIINGRDKVVVRKHIFHPEFAFEQSYINTRATTVDSAWYQAQQLSFFGVMVRNLGYQDFRGWAGYSGTWTSHLFALLLEIPLGACFRSPQLRDGFLDSRPCLVTPKLLCQ